MSTDPVPVVVVDDEPMVCEFLRTILTATGEITVAAVAHDGTEGIAATRQHRPAVVLTDLRMPGMDGVHATREIRALSDPPTVVAMTTVDTDRHVLDALDAGALTRGAAPVAGGVARPNHDGVPTRSWQPSANGNALSWPWLRTDCPMRISRLGCISAKAP